MCPKSSLSRSTSPLPPPAPEFTMSRNSVDKRPSTPPSSLPTSPTNSRDVALRTPLKISRSRHQSFAPFTPQSLRSSRSPVTPKNSQDQARVTTPTHKLSTAQTPNWHVHEDTLSNSSGSQEYKAPGKPLFFPAYIPALPMDTQSFVEPTTPTKHLGPFTPQVTKQTRDPLRLEMSNYAVAEDLRVRGSLTDPPPRRRMGRPALSDENSPGLVIIKPLDINVPIPQIEAKTETRPYPRLPDACASCGSRERLSLLQPCQHQICASCVNGSLNVISDRIHTDIATQRAFIPTSRYNHLSNDAFNPSGSRPNRPNRPNRLRAPHGPSTLENSPVLPVAPSLDGAVLRIDNVPWDATPTMLEQWLGGPIIQCHVLLDRADGRTLNHAYVETSTGAARAALSSHQNKTLGYGRRSRPVTLTLSEQEELMHDAIIPVLDREVRGNHPSPRSVAHWFQASRISHCLRTLSYVALDSEAAAYWFLLSTLVKFPVPDVFAPGMAPDMLFDVTTYALEKYETLVGSREYDCVLHTRLIAGALHCRAFTDRQLQLLLRFTNRPLPVIQQNPAPNPKSHVTTQGFSHQPRLPFAPNPVQHSWHKGAVQLPVDHGLYATTDPYDRVAQDFGIDPSLVYALAERLTLHGSTTAASLGRF
ncbi:hypothetical protein FRC06_008096 [Ceratobasidium sp. 370]|nr:hypothetical protein FRC06_008096 [Ceratobasidium sp. 370]